MTSSYWRNTRTQRLQSDPRSEAATLTFHRRLPGYAPTRLMEVPEFAALGGVARVLVKAEVERFGLPSFKGLGASWATYRVLCDRLGFEPEWTEIDELAQIVADKLGGLRLATATDGNHGRAVAFMARMLGFEAVIYVPAGTAESRIRDIESEGAEVRVHEGTYDDAVAEAAKLESDQTLVVSDTSWPGYEDPPRWVIEGYSTIFGELRSQLAGLGLAGFGSVDLVVVPIGVGALAAASARSLRAGLAAHVNPRLIGVEPNSAACVSAAVRAGEVVEVPGPHPSIMAGLNCGLASPVALPSVANGFAGFVTIDDDRVRDAMRTMAANGLDVGETGAAALAALTTLNDEHRAESGLQAGDVVVLLATEGVTDPASFEAIVGRPPH